MEPMGLCGEAANASPSPQVALEPERALTALRSQTDTLKLGRVHLLSGRAGVFLEEACSLLQLVQG